MAAKPRRSTYPPSEVSVFRKAGKILAVALVAYMVVVYVVNYGQRGGA